MGIDAKATIEEIRRRAVERAKEESERATRLERVFIALEDEYPEIYSQLTEIPHVASIKRNAEIWCSVKVDTIAAAFDLIRSAGIEPLVLTKEQNGCTAIRYHVADKDHGERMHDIGCVLLQHESNAMTQGSTVQTVRVYFDLRASYEPELPDTSVVRLDIQIRKEGPQIRARREEDRRGRSIITGWELPYTFNGERIKWASGSIEYPNTFTEYFSGCDTLDDLIEAYPQLVAIDS